MENNNNHITYTASDFERYYNGTMPGPQMHALEKAALEDPFLADALDGYAFAKTPVSDIEDLAEQIPPVKEDKKTPVIGFTKMWLRIAAVLILVTGIGYITYTSNNDTDAPISKTLAENKNNAVVAPVNTTVSETKTDTAHFLNTEKKLADVPAKVPATITSNQYANATTTAAPPTQPSLPSSSSYKAETETNNISADEDRATVKEKPQSELVKKMYQAPGLKYQLQGQVTDDKGEPIPFASINFKNKLATSTDANGNFSLQTKDSLLLANISAAGYAAVNQNLSTNTRLNNITLGRQQQELNEVVVTTMGTQRKMKEVTSSNTQIVEKALQGKVAGVNISTDPQPVRGMANYDSYIDSAVTKIKLRAQPLHGEVKLSFKVNRQGEPVRIKVERSLSQEYDEAAIRLLQQGPKWQFSHGKRTTKTIEF